MATEPRPAIEWHDRIASTQDLAHERAHRGAPHGAAIAARVQTGGRGTRGRAWSSPAGGLWLSVIARPAEVGRLECASLRIGLALAAAIERSTGLEAGRIGVKWPNDLVLDDRKLAGVLCEARWQGDQPAWMVVGVGLNVRNPIPPAAGAAARLADLVPHATAEALAGPVVEAVLAGLTRSGPLGPEELAAFSVRDWLRDRDLAAPVAGRAAGVAASGRLRVAIGGGWVEIAETVTLAGLARGDGTR